ncbi:histidinol dehydrogenase, partial [bacterium]|nr:histidinol dehydrogenase [bacterium]
MIKIFDYKKDRLKVGRYLELINVTDDDAEKTVRAIVENVRSKGDTALLSYIKKFEAASLKKEELRVPDREIDDAVKKVGKDFLSILSEAKNNIIRYHKKGVLKSFLYDDGDNVKLGKVVQPIENAGVYIPGGKAVYPSSVLMNVIPAKIAGVKNIYAASPPDKNKNVNKYILAACSVLGVRDIFKMGGAHAVAAFAYGTDTVPKVDKIVGPGNIYVATAKKLVYGDVDIDMIAGPSEVVVCADSSANPAYLVSELFAQAEHDENARAVMVTTSKKTAEKVQIEIKRQIKLRARKEIIKKSLKNNGAIILVNSVEQCAEIINT